MEPNWDFAKTLTHFVSGGIVIFDRDGKVLLINDNLADLCNCPKADLTDFEAFQEQVFHKDAERAQVEEMFRAGFEGRVIGPIGLTIEGKDEKPTYVDMLIAPVLDESRQVVAVGVVFFDVTQRKALEKEHEEMRLEYLNASRMALLGELTSGIAHNINNPLAGLLGYLDLLAEDYPDDERIKKCIKQCRRISDLVQNLAYHGRNAQMSGRVRVDVNELVNETLLLITSSKLYANSVIETELSPEPVIVKVNPGDLTHVLVNLLHNARDAVWGMADGRIIVRTMAQGDEAVLVVEDNGTGIPEKIQDRIFEPFFTTKSREPTPDQSPEGNGLGLTTARQLINQQGGRIEFTSQVGKGTVFRVTLPREVD
jgi:signal transduction histidine kinase